MPTARQVFQYVELAASLAPVPALGAAVILVEEIYNAIVRIALRKQECYALASHTQDVLMVIAQHAQGVEGSMLEPAVNHILNVIEEIRNDMAAWAQYRSAHSFFRNSEILDIIQSHKVSLDRSLDMLGLAHILLTAKMNQLYLEARESDKGQIELLHLKQDALMTDMTHLRELLKNRDSHPASEVEAAKEQLRHYRMNSLEVAPDPELTYEVHLISKRAIHQGSTYDVYQGLWLEETMVALKIFRGTEPTTKQKMRMSRQVDLWRTINHPHVVQLLGFAEIDANQLYLVTHWMENRDAITYLSRKPTADRLKLLIDILKGLKHLHSLKIMHGGLCGSNVLVDSKGSAVLSDFSLSKFLDDGVMFTQSSGPSAAMRWMAPEIQNQDILTCQADVYAWGMTALQILTGKIPYYTIKPLGKLVRAVIVNRETPARADYDSPYLTDDLWEVISSCWAWNPDERPTVDKLLFSLMGIRQRRAKRHEA